MAYALHDSRLRVAVEQRAQATADGWPPLSETQRARIAAVFAAPRGRARRLEAA